MSQMTWKITTVEALAQADANQQLPKGCCPYAGQPAFSGSLLRRCRAAGLTSCEAALYKTPTHQSCPYYTTAQIQKTTNKETH